MINPAALNAIIKGDIENYEVATTPGGIERQEAKGQEELVHTEMLPKEMHNAHRDQLEKIGFVFGENIDDLFVKAQLPRGWKKLATDHSMWSELHDEQSRVRARIFYKAAFYDRSANISFSTRYKIDPYHTPCEGHTETVVKDGDKIIFSAGTRLDDHGQESYNLGRSQKAAAYSWLTEHYPDWENPAAYWDQDN